MSNKSLGDRRQVEEYVECELRQAAPPGWKCIRPTAGPLWWSIKRISIPIGEWSDQEYSLHVSEDLRWFIVTYGNNDIGPGSMQQELQQARVIPASSLERYSLGSCVQFIMDHCMPNQWGYT